ncbi:dipeptidase 1 [Neodiprion pinetum]|uniref:Dipeptidase n=2 Tax=Neodiprion lecontei TaxID=441921 RepID=A0A6J0BZF1_NEOLC|nr:dipeptidase 1 isoform X1 [Neodiprion lecontei]XP_046423828.1 dipeptidase 1-like isoform X1 [Neodiprion fabricii]XP_046423829.1 dipeptidase 1-like isoform X1 [Neodiprion fabricii]XP_046480538.1 dipeptidase 1-like isoform X1 [Neodiprion pinetum]XP_046480539.1 dipeptidase 1-like isoform X1 [Neodiprion pinetum]XP_046595040.1 dipeptidase 1 isoform X1 [Neodiprion lecontei]XP_046614474.1 dipeptidase 1-like isoform X1 [Neodiprion virginianus]
MFQLYEDSRADGLGYHPSHRREKEVDILETCLQLSSPELICKMPNGDVSRRIKEGLASSSRKENQSSREDGTKLGKRWFVILGLLFLGCALVAGVGLPLALELRSSHLLEARLLVVKRILSEMPLIDGHNDFAWNLRQRGGTARNFPFEDDLSKNLTWGPEWQTDLVRLRRGNVGAQFWSAYVPCEAQFLDAVQLTLEQIDLVRRLTSKHPTGMRLVTSSAELEGAHRDGMIASLVGLEGGHSIGSSLAVLRSFHLLGARYMTLTHRCNTPWADSSLVEDPNEDVPLDYHSSGLSTFGRAIVKELNRLGMLVDLSHVSTQTMRAALAVTKAPVIFSHSAARALCNSSRNVPDDILRYLPINGGLVMVSFDSAHLSCSSSASMHDVIAHITHIRKTAGVNHVGLGAGYDGIISPPAELPDVSGYPLLLAELTRDRRWSAADIKKLAGGNLLRVLKEAETQSLALLAQQPSEEWIAQELIEDTAYCRYHDA